MRAVNLIPAEARRGSAGGSGTSVHAFLALLALLVVAVTAYVLTANRVTAARAQLGDVTARTQVVTRRLDGLKPYEDFASLEQRRLSTVRSLIASRFDWEQTLHDLSRVTTPAVALTTVTGTVSPNVQSEGSTGAASSFRSDLPNPALELAGCATSNREVVRLLSRLRAMKNVVRVTLADSTKPDTATATSGAATTGGAGDGCGGSDQWPAFDIVVFYAPRPGGSVAAPTSGATPAATTGSSPSSSRPASSTASTGSTP